MSLRITIDVPAEGNVRTHLVTPPGMKPLDAVPLLRRAIASLEAEIEGVGRCPAHRATEQPDFLYFECPDCGFNSVQKAEFSGSHYCPLCAGDSGHDVRMHSRAARDTDQVEGKDARHG